MEFSEKYAIEKEVDGEQGWYCPVCNSELLYKACEYCDDTERWLGCPKCNLDFNKKEGFYGKRNGG